MKKYVCVKEDYSVKGRGSYPPFPQELYIHYIMTDVEVPDTGPWDYWGTVINTGEKRGFSKSEIDFETDDPNELVTYYVVESL